MKNISVVFLVLVISFLIIGGCGGDSDNCEFDILTVLNGSDSEVQDSFWECVDSNDDMFSFVIFEDGTGASTNIGVFDWQQTGCNTILISTGIGDTEAVDIVVNGNDLSFSLESGVEGLGGIDVQCVLIPEQ